MATTQSKPKQPRKPKEPKSPEDIVIDFDSNWKFLIEKYYFQFIAFFIPDLYADIDVTRAPVFLDNELQTIWRSMKTGLKMTDKLVKVWLKNGEERWVLVHIEVQARFETLFSKRMFTISYRILDKHKVEPVALAVFVDTLIPKQFDTYENKIYGTETRYKYNAYKIIEQIESELLKREGNLFALVVLANLRTIQTKKAGGEFDRFEFKKHLYNLLTERNFDPDVYYDLLNFINFLMVLPEPLELAYKDYSNQTPKNEGNMLKMKLAPSTLAHINARTVEAYGMDVPMAKRQIQIEKRKVRLAEAKAKETEAKAKETEAKAKIEANTKVVLALQFDRTVEQLAEILNISVEEVNGILNEQASKN